MNRLRQSERLYMENKMYMRARTFLRARALDILGHFATPQNGIHILNGHRIQKEAEPETFKKQLEELSKYVKFVKIETAIEMIMNKIEPQEPIVAFTFDDGFMDCYNIFAPVLEQYGVNAMFFVNPNYVEGDSAYIQNFNAQIVMTPNKMPMRWTQLQELSNRGHVIAAHTMDHYMINCDDTETLKYQIITCKNIIEENIGKPCDYFAFPYGKLTQANKKSIDIACATYKYVFSQSNYKEYFSFDGRVINRRHFEPFWSINHVKYFLSCKKNF